MPHQALHIRNGLTGWLYRNILKRALFHGDPERVHDGMTRLGEILGQYALGRTITRMTFGNPLLPELRQEIEGVVFDNPIGLSGGFDKNAALTDIIPQVGFGFMEVGSVTARAYEGNAGQRLWRLKKSESLVVYYGLKNIGAEKIAARLEEKLERRKFAAPVGINIAKTNAAETNKKDIGIADYVTTYRRLLSIGDLFTINISCPNVTGGQPFHDPEWLDELLSEIEKVDGEHVATPKKPIFIKVSPDLPHSELDAILEVAARHRVTGFICTNLTKRRDLTTITDIDVPQCGGISGKVLEPLSNEIIKYVYQHGQRGDGKRFVIVGVGGIFSAEDAYRKIRAGATLLELITGMIFRGPQLISEIQLGLVELLKRDGYTHISEAIGADYRT